MDRILVWDWPTRVGHWLMALSFLIAYVTGESEAWRLVHAMAGGALAAIVVFRLVWGVLGSRHARFASFVRGPAAAWRYLGGLARGRATHHTGHNPAGAWAILALLGLALLTTLSGWLYYQDMGGDWLESMHEATAGIMLGVVAVHLAGVLLGSLAHGENLAAAMLTGYKRGPAAEAIARSWAWLAWLLPGFALLGAWWLSR